MKSAHHFCGCQTLEKTFFDEKTQVNMETKNHLDREIQASSVIKNPSIEYPFFKKM